MKTVCHSILLFAVSLVVDTGALEVSRDGTSAARVTNTIRERTAVEIARLHDAGLDKDVLLSFIQSRRVPYSATADDILFLHENKVPEEVIVSWINRGSALISSSVQAQAQALAPARSPDLVAAYAQPPQTVVKQQPIVYQAAPAVISVPAVTYS